MWSWMAERVRIDVLGLGFGLEGGGDEERAGQQERESAQGICHTRSLLLAGDAFHGENHFLRGAIALTVDAGFDGVGGEAAVEDALWEVHGPGFRRWRRNR